MRIGHGYDVHRLVSGRALMLGGTEIEYEKGLLGHSDADVLSHAVIDALLGAAGEKDIGCQFPDSDPAFEGVSGSELLRRTADIVRRAGFYIEYIDATVIAQSPKLSPYIGKMRAATASALGIEPSLVNIKATTEEGLGFTGTGEGIAAHAVCLLGKAL